MIKKISFVAGALAGLWLAGGASAQQAVVACPSQERLQQYAQANGGTVPEDCRQITITEAGNGVCRFALGEGGDGDGLMSALAGAAVPTEWWALCGSLEEAAE